MINKIIKGLLLVGFLGGIALMGPKGVAADTCVGGYYDTYGNYVQPNCYPDNSSYNYNNYYSSQYPYYYNNYYDNSSYYNQYPYYQSSYYGNYPYSCGFGYVWKNGSCISNTDDCKMVFGPNVGYGTPGTNNNSTCYCAAGYDWNYNRTSCIPVNYGQAYYYQYPQYNNPPAVQSQLAFLYAQLQSILDQLRQYGYNY